MNYQEVTTFFSWQSDIDRQSNFIRMALVQATTEIQEENLKIVNQEATREDPGSPNISTTIIEKIKLSDIFIADVTIINKKNYQLNRAKLLGIVSGNIGTLENAEYTLIAPVRPMPNPNVMFELGFAVALLGWKRVIILNNLRYSSLDDLPFDIRNHRATSFSAKKFNESEMGNLKGIIKQAIKQILQSNPNREVAKVIESDENIKRKRDVEELTSILEEIDFDDILGSIDTLPYQLSDRVAFYFEFSEKYFDTYFDLYDRETKSEFRKLFEKFHAVVPSPLYYTPTPGSRYYSLKSEDLKELDLNFRNNIPIKLEEFKEQTLKIRTIVREKYLEVDINETNREARNKYTKLHKLD